jgi:hypothetical protein
MVALFAPGLLVGSIAGCGSCGGDESKKKSTVDESKMPGASEVRALAKAQGVDPTEVRCAAIGDSQAFTCRTELEEAQVTKLVSGWGLLPDDPADITIMRGKKFGCERFGDFSPDASGSFKSWGSKDKPAAVGNMQYARLYYRSDFGRVCIEMERLAM